MTFGAIKDRIADELVRPDLASQIALAVNDAIKEAANNRFWFNEVRGLTFATAVSQDFYTPTNYAYIGKIDALWLIVNGQRRNMQPVNALTIENWKEGQTTLTGEPAYFARYGAGLLFWMPPSGVWSVFLDGTTRFAPLVADSDTNPYVEEGERYIRALAKANILENVAREFDEADRQWQVSEREKRVLLTATHDRIATNTLAPAL